MQLHNMRPTIWRPFTQLATSSAPLHVDYAKEARLYLKDGRSIIDAISSWWVITHGHCHPVLMEAIRKQTKKLDQVIFAGFHHDPAEEVAGLLTDLLPSSFKHVFFSDNGSTAVEVALKMAIQACAQRGESRRTKFLGFSHSYHGDTVGAMSVGADADFTKPYNTMQFSVLRANQGQSIHDPIEAFTEHYKQLIETYSKEIAGVIVEPLVQGAHGMIMWPTEAVNEIIAAAKKHNIYVIFDEVMTGFGRTGKMFAFEHLNDTPDIICLSKGLTGGTLPMSVTVTTSDLFDAFWSEDKGKMFFHGHSFTANPIACAVAAANIKLLIDSDMKSEWQRIESTHQKFAEQLTSHSAVKECRVTGTVAAVELHAAAEGYLSKAGEGVFDFAVNQGVLLRPLGNVVYLLPPYCTTNAELSQCWDVLGSAVDWLTR